mgnify:CR=1 FL=1
MLRPERMTRTLIVGPREKLASTIETLHAMKLLHVIDHHGEDEDGSDLLRQLLHRPCILHA